MPINCPQLAAGLLLSLTTLTAEATLTPYISDGKAVVYSSVSDITWTGDANLLGTLEASNPNLVSIIISTIGSIADSPNFYDTPRYSGSHTLTTDDFGTNGLASWFGAKAFTSYLNNINYAGSHQWALPTNVGANQWEYYTDGEFGRLYYTDLGGTPEKVPDTANFENVQNYPYWTETESGPDLVWWFSFNYGGYQWSAGKNTQFYPWAVSPGQVSAIPISGAFWLLGSGLFGLVSLRRSRPPR